MATVTKVANLIIARRSFIVNLEATSFDHHILFLVVGQIDMKMKNGGGWTNDESGDFHVSVSLCPNLSAAGQRTDTYSQRGQVG